MKWLVDGNALVALVVDDAENAWAHEAFFVRFGAAIFAPAAPAFFFIAQVHQLGGHCGFCGQRIRPTPDSTRIP